MPERTQDGEAQLVLHISCMKRGDPPRPQSPFHNPFGSLAAQRDALPAGPSQPLVVPLEEARGPALAVVRRERKGHGGKEVTRVQRLELPAAELARWCHELKRSLGTGGQVDGAELVFQGDLRERLAVALRARGVRKVTVA